MEKNLQTTPMNDNAVINNALMVETIPLAILEYYVQTYTQISLRGNFFGKLRRGHVDTVQDLLLISRGHLLRINGIGFGSLKLIDQLKKVIIQNYYELYAIAHCINALTFNHVSETTPSAVKEPSDTNNDKLIA